MTEANAARSEVAQAANRAIVRDDIRRAGSALERGGIARPFGGRIARLAGQHDQAVARPDRKRLVARRVAGRGNDRDILGQLMVALELLVAAAW